MYVDRDKALALRLHPLEVDLERWRLKLFAKAIGETNPIYTDVDAARAAGYPDLPAPPSFLGNSIELDIPDPMAWLYATGVAHGATLHGGQSLTYKAMAFAGDHLQLRRRISDVYLRKGGALEFVVKETQIWRGDEHLATALCSIAVMHPEAGK